LGIAGVGVLLATGLVLLALRILQRRLPTDAHDELTLLRTLAAAAALCGLVIVAMTGMWPHHAQVLYVGCVLTCVAVARHLQELRLPSAGVVGALIGVALLLSGSFLPETYPTSGVSAVQRFEALTTRSPETEALLAVSPTGTYARLGQHDDEGHAEGLWPWHLACPRFHQYPWDAGAILEDVLDCAKGQPHLIVSDSIEPIQHPRDQQTWNSYVERVEAMLAAQYACDPYPGGRTCVVVPAAGQQEPGAQ
jgi:hypothetical protein